MSKSKQITVNNVEVQIVRKRIKNLHLRVSAPDGCVRVSAPMHVHDIEVQQMVFLRLDWIKKHQLRLASRAAPLELKMVSGENHFYLGVSYPLEVFEQRGKQAAALTEKSTLQLYVRPDTCAVKRARILNEWYRQQIKALIPGLIEKWEPVIGVKVDDWGIKKMKTRWGTCNISDSRIWLNLELIKRPLECLEYVLVHEMVHLLERYHNQRFKAYMDEFLPDWRLQDTALKCEPLLRFV